MAGPGQPEKSIEEKRTTMTVRVCPKWLKKFRKWSKLQDDSQSRQVEKGVNLLIEDRNK